MNQEQRPQENIDKIALEASEVWAMVARNTRRLAGENAILKQELVKRDNRISQLTKEKEPEPAPEEPPEPPEPPENEAVKEYTA
jgi:hypothetical protein